MRARTLTVDAANPFKVQDEVVNAVVQNSGGATVLRMLLQHAGDDVLQRGWDLRIESSDRRRRFVQDTLASGNEASRGKGMPPG